jgi:hypothetical protein
VAEACPGASSAEVLRELAVSPLPVPPDAQPREERLLLEPQVLQEFLPVRQGQQS